MADLIDRKAVMDLLVDGECYTVDELLTAIAALPAQGVPEIEERKFYHDAWPLQKLLEARALGNGLLTDDGEAWRYRLTHSDARGKYDVLYRPTRKIAALAAYRGDTK